MEYTQISVLKIVHNFSITQIKGDAFSVTGTYKVLMVSNNDDGFLIFGVADDNKKLHWISPNACDIIPNKE